MSVVNLLKIEAIQVVFLRKVSYSFDERCSVLLRPHIGREIPRTTPTSERYEGFDSLYATQLVELLVNFLKSVRSNLKLTFDCASLTN